VIDRYLDELRGLLPAVSRRRVLEEVEEHLRLSAREVGEKEALARFGAAREVAAEYRARARRFYALLALGFAAAFPLLTYPIPENTLPPAPWPAGQMPGELAWKQDGTIWLFAVAVVAALVALVGFARVRALFVPAAAVALLALVGVGVLGTVLTVEWRDHVPGTPLGLVALGPLQGLVASAGLALLARARTASI
jgi:hypothetical protein